MKSHLITIIHTNRDTDTSEEECNGLGVACRENDFAISFNQTKIWNEDTYSLIKVLSNGQEHPQPVVVKHFGGVTNERIDQHFKEKPRIKTLQLSKQMQLYDFNSTKPPSPRDDQTILFDENLFTDTGHRCSGRKVYKHKTNGTLWYVDSKHYGEAAHLEVFDANQKGIGTAHIQTGKITTSKKCQKRTIDLL